MKGTDFFSENVRHWVLKAETVALVLEMQLRLKSSEQDQKLSAIKFTICNDGVSGARFLAPLECLACQL